jgi:hypothetical protein
LYTVSRKPVETRYTTRATVKMTVLRREKLGIIGYSDAAIVTV